jgi:hypothetical protein
MVNPRNKWSYKDTCEEPALRIFTRQTAWPAFVEGLAVPGLGSCYGG